MKRTGEILKKAREKRGLSINEIALSLKISSKVLKAIEDGDVNQLPAKTFLRGFVQSYANYLRLDVNAVLTLFQEEMGSTRPSPLIQMPEQDATLDETERKSGEGAPAKPSNSPSSSEKSFSKLSTNNNSRTITFSILGVLLVGLIIFTKKMIDKYQKETVVEGVEVTTPLNTGGADTATGSTSASPSPLATVMSTPLTTPTPAQSSTPLPTPTPIHTSTPSHTPTPGSTATPKPTVTPATTPSPTTTAKPSATPTPTPASSPSASPSPSPSASPSPANRPVEVIMEALDRVEIEYSVSGGKMEKMVLNAEQIHTFKSKGGLRLNVSNGGAVNVIVNGKDLGIPGNLGKPVKLNF